jgi:hypothetical protein
VTIRRAIILLALVVAIAVGASYLPLDFLRPAVERALAHGLGREVEVRGGVFLDLFGAPGLTLDDVVIHEDPRAGIEPFAYVPSLEARVRWLSLFHRRLEFAYLNLLEAQGQAPTLNIVKTEAGPWNFQFLLDSAAPAGAASQGAASSNSGVPAIRMRTGRVNFKFGDTKSIFYFNEADLDVAPNRDGSVELRFGGAPSRTDSTARDFGRFFVNGTWKSSPSQSLDLNVDLERSSLAEISRLFDPRGFGVHGIIALQAQLSGPPSGLEISGQLQVDDVHRWDLVPQGGGWKLPFKGGLDLRGEKMEIASAAADGAQQDAAVSFSFRAWNFLSRTQWEAGAQLNQIPLADLAEVARHMGAALPDQVAAEGAVSGTLSYNEDGLTGHVELKDASLTLAGAQSVHARSAALDIAGGEVSLEPSTVEIGEKDSAELQGAYAIQPHTLDLRITTRGMSVGDMRSFGLAAIPLLDQTKQGTWRGWARYRAGEWSGEYELLNARISVDGLADPLRIQSASVKLSGERVAVTKLRAKAGEIAFTGDYHWEPDAVRPHKFNIVIEEADTAELARLLAPTLVRERGFLARTLRLDSAPAPDWLKSRRADGSISIGTLTGGEVSLNVNQARLLWDGEIVRLMGVDATALGANFGGSAVAGDLEVDLGVDQRGDAPHYHFDGKINDVPYKGGKLDFDGTFDASGGGLQLIETAHAEGHLRARSIVFAPDAEFPIASACFELQGTHWKLGSVEVTQGGEIYFGTGASQSDGKMVLDLMKGSRQVRFSGALFAAIP